GFWPSLLKPERHVWSSSCSNGQPSSVSACSSSAEVIAATLPGASVARQHHGGLRERRRRPELAERVDLLREVAVALDDRDLIRELRLDRNRAGGDARGSRVRSRAALRGGEHVRERLVVLDLVDLVVVVGVDAERVVLRDQLRRIEVRQLAAGE